ncbi:MAG TPA: hypothetical protein VFN35_35160 [Ktedonobacteraceae bacterium]|nr:hypothetical protein [Ktedonobacteraceae bacterium]
MQVIYQRCCGLDVHKKTVVATILITSPDGTIEKKTRTFSTMTTGIYWRPVYQLLEEGHTILLVNAQHIKAVCIASQKSSSANSFPLPLLDLQRRHREDTSVLMPSGQIGT